jgi:hypothetical protein
LKAEILINVAVTYLRSLYDTNWKQLARNTRSAAFEVTRILTVIYWFMAPSFTVACGHQCFERKYTVFIFNVEVIPEDGNSIFVQNADAHLLEYSVSQHRRPHH